ncbi:MAG: hypothetical protein V4466_18240, partial [Pseudomonadota bacterium]
MKPLLPALALAFAVSAPAMAAPAPAWTVDKAASKVTFASSFDGGAFTGSFRNWTAAIRFDPANLAAVAAVAPASPVQPGDAKRRGAVGGLAASAASSPTLPRQYTFVADKHCFI